MRLAARGLRDMDEGPEVIEDAEEVAVVRRQARGVQWRALVLAALLTAVGVALG